MKIGDTYTWQPEGWDSVAEKTAAGGKRLIPRTLTGRVIAINREHRHFTVAGEVNGYVIRQTFKLSE